MRQISIGQPPRFEGDPKAFCAKAADWMLRTASELEEYSKANDIPVRQVYTTANFTAARTIDADAATTAEIADVLSTLIEDLKNKGILT
jgi:hypothetical protein